MKGITREYEGDVTFTSNDDGTYKAVKGEGCNDLTPISKELKKEYRAACVKWGNKERKRFSRHLKRLGLPPADKRGGKRKIDRETVREASKAEHKKALLAEVKRALKSGLLTVGDLKSLIK